MSGSRRPLAAAAVVVVVVVAVLLFLVLTRPPAAAPSEGILGRTAVNGSPMVALEDACFSGYLVRPGGRDPAGTPVYAVTFQLKGTPRDTADLATTLGQRDCTVDVLRATAAVSRPSGPGMPGRVSVSYVTPAGARIISP